MTIPLKKQLFFNLLLNFSLTRIQKHTQQISLNHGKKKLISNRYSYVISFVLNQWYRCLWRERESLFYFCVVVVYFRLLMTLSTKRRWMQTHRIQVYMHLEKPMVIFQHLARNTRYLLFFKKL